MMSSYIRSAYSLNPMSTLCLCIYSFTIPSPPLFGQDQTTKVTVMILLPLFTKCSD